MWGKNANDTAFHYFESMADTAYICGRRQRAANIKAGGIRDVVCSACKRHYLALPEHRRNPRQTTHSMAISTTTTRNGGRAAADAADVPAQAAPVEAINRYEGKETPEHLTTQEFEAEYLRAVSDVIERQKEQSLDALRSLRRGGQGSGSQAAISAFKTEELERKSEVLASMQGSPYFGRIDFFEKDSPHSEMIFIGRSTVEDKSGGFLIYDWRTPLCSMYYGFQTGAASYRAPMGFISGEIVLKRQYEIKNGKIAAMYGAGGDVIAQEAADAMLLSLLNRNSSGKMRQIVQSIQAEQDTIIRSAGDVVVVQGPAGSGKTIIALHRAAYLLYHMRLERERLAQRYGHISAQRMLVFSPNSVFADYISRVLPDLHEDQITQVILEQFLQSELIRQLRADRQASDYEIETKEDHYEAMLNGGESSNAHRRTSGSAFKCSATMLLALELYAQRLEEQVEAAFDDLELSIAGVVLADANQRLFYSRAEMVRQFRLGSGDAGLVSRIARVLSKIREEINDYAKSPAVQSSTVKRLERERTRLAERLRPFRERGLIELYQFLWQNIDILNEACRQEETTYPGEEIAGDTLAVLKSGRIPYEDVVPILLLCGFYRGFPAHIRDMDHAVVDEAQDYSLAHYEYIKRCLPSKCTLTIVGDVNQAINPVLNLHSYDVLETVFPSRIKRLELTKSYRSSLEITEFASRILPESPRMDNVRRSGSRPKLVSVPIGKNTDAAIVQVLGQLADKEYNSIAILCKTRRDAEALYHRLHPKITLTLLTGGTEKFVQGVFILPVHLAKGLEFDAVILQDAGNATYGREEERKFLYTACTRALHELYVCYSGELSPLLDGQNEALCDKIEM
jgi:DNA helicase II / ATP-dependent DNA helicase PcrA